MILWMVSLINFSLLYAGIQIETRGLDAKDVEFIILIPEGLPSIYFLSTSILVPAKETSLEDVAGIVLKWNKPDKKSAIE